MDDSTGTKKLSITVYALMFPFSSLVNTTNYETLDEFITILCRINNWYPHIKVVRNCELINTKENLSKTLLELGFTNDTKLHVTMDFGRDPIHPVVKNII